MLANDPGVFEMARGLAAQLLKQPGLDDRGRIRLAYRRCLGREPATEESRRLLDYVSRQAQAYERPGAEPEKVAPGDLPAGCRPAIGAAWTCAARVLMNLDEFITRE